MYQTRRTKAANYRKASRWVGWGGVILCALFAGLWFVLETVVNKKAYADMEKTFDLLPLPVLIAAAVAVLCIIIAIILRIIAHHHAKKALALRNIPKRAARAAKSVREAFSLSPLPE